ncbi:hypothetical protein [Deinococcus sp.]|uniref:hypothetical protein n=1 Tax=Deinococcus sp. TaxID=47478 RepID=UPI0025F295A5|nr:hypothetical protein [Deinococcus sp.]
MRKPNKQSGKQPGSGVLSALTVAWHRLRYRLGIMAKPRPVSVPEVAVSFRELPGTRVGFWIVAPCPHCAQTHFHPAGSGQADPLERLGEVEARCGLGRYVMGLPPRPRSKKERKAVNKRGRRVGGESDDWDE